MKCVVLLARCNLVPWEGSKEGLWETRTLGSPVKIATEHPQVPISKRFARLRLLQQHMACDRWTGRGAGDAAAANQPLSRTKGLTKLVQAASLAQSWRPSAPRRTPPIAASANRKRGICLAAKSRPAVLGETAPVQAKAEGSTGQCLPANPN